MSALKILYVEDEPDIREVACLALQLDPDIRVSSAESGEAALTMVADGDFRPDVLLLDVMMPGMDGPGLLRVLRERAQTAATPVVFMTARTQAQDRQRLMDLGAVGVINKPFDPMSLAKQLKAVLAAETPA